MAAWRTASMARSSAHAEGKRLSSTYSSKSGCSSRTIWAAVWAASTLEDSPRVKARYSVGTPFCAAAEKTS